MAQIQTKWNPENYEIRSRGVEQQLEPLIIHVTTLVNSDKVEKRKKGRGKSKKAPALVAAVERAIKNFIEKGEQIAHENPQVCKEMLAVVEEIRTLGDKMSLASHAFAESPCESEKRTEMVKVARALLGAVTRLLILADMVDVQLLVQSVTSVRTYLDKLRTVPYDQLIEELKQYNKISNNLLNQAAKRQREISNPQIRDDLAAARAVLKKSSTMLLSASRVYVSHPDDPAAKANKDQILKEICEAVDTIGNVAQGRKPLGSGKYEGSGRLATNLDNLERTGSVNYREERTKQHLEQQLEELVNGAMLISDSGTLKDERKNKIVAGCDAVKAALQNLLSQSMQRPTSGVTNQAVHDVTKTTKDLRRQLRKAVADKVSDRFLGSHSPLAALIEAAFNGDLQEVETRAAIFNDHCQKLTEVAHQVCELSNNEEGVKMVRCAADQLATLSPEVINAARILASHPQSEVAHENMDLFKQNWEDQVKLLLEAVDEITTIDDVLSVLDNQMYEDMNQYMAAVQQHNPELLKSVAENIKGRTGRICEIVTTDMDNYEPCLYTKEVLEAVKILGEDTEGFTRKTEKIITTMERNPDQEIDENEFIDATRLVYDGLRDVRRAVLMNRADEDLDPEEVEVEENYTTETIITTTTITTDSTTTTEESEDMGGITVARQAMNQLPETQKSKILEQVENFQSEKQTFDKEVMKWDEASNDIVALAKFMCMIMIQMTDFVRQKGPLKSTADVIKAAKTISEAGNKLDKLTRQIAEQCPEGTIKNDLLAYIERVALYSHQINIIAKVKADVEHNSNEELILAGVESATSLIENAKNLMNAVVLTVKASYVATKYTRQTTSAIVWKMKVPEKKPLVRLEKPKEVKAIVRRASTRMPQHPIRVLSEFQI